MSNTPYAISQHRVLQISKFSLPEIIIAYVVCCINAKYQQPSQLMLDIIYLFLSWLTKLADDVVHVCVHLQMIYLFLNSILFNIICCEKLSIIYNVWFWEWYNHTKMWTYYNKLAQYRIVHTPWSFVHLTMLKQVIIGQT